MKSVITFMVALVTAAPVAAEGIIPRERHATAEREGRFSGDVARKTMDQFAACVLDRKRKMVIKALAMQPDSPEQNEIFGRLAKTECIADAELRFNGPAFRGSLYKALVRKQFGRKDVFLAPAPGADPQATLKENVAKYGDESELLTFASCVVHKDPANARDAILSAAGSASEEAALAALSNVYSQCLYEDDSLRFSKTRLIAMLAEAYYREATASTEATAAQH